MEEMFSRPWQARTGLKPIILSNPSFLSPHTVQNLYTHALLRIPLLKKSKCSLSSPCSLADPYSLSTHKSRYWSSYLLDTFEARI